MATDVTSTVESIAGFIQPFECLEYWSNHSSVDIQEPFPGAVTEDRVTGMRLTPSGTPENADTLEVRAQIGGVPGILRAAFLWRPTTTPTASDWRGWDALNTQTSSRLVYAAGSATNGVDNPSAVVCRSGRIVCAVEGFTESSGLRAIGIYIKDPDDSTYTALPSAVYSETVGVTNYQQRRICPAMVLLPGNVIELYHCRWSEDRDKLQIGKLISYDEGDTWEVASYGVLETPRDGYEYASGPATAIHVERLRVAYGGGQWSLWIGERNDSQTTNVRQCYSDDGETFVAYEGFGASLGDVIYAQGFFLAFAYTFSVAEGDGGTVRDPYVMRYADAEVAQGGQAIGLNGSYTQLGTDGDGGTHPIDHVGAALVTEGNGSIWAYYQLSDDFGQWYAAYSPDAGATWTDHDAADVGTTWHHGDSSSTEVGPAWPCGVNCRGQAVLLHVHAEVGATSAAMVSLWETRLGGYSTVTLPYSRGQARSPISQPTYDLCWYPVDDPDVFSRWTAGHTGTPTHTITAGGLYRMAGAASGADVSSWSYSAGAAGQRRALARFVVDPTDGSASGTFALTIDLHPVSAALASYAVTVTAAMGGNLVATDVAGATTLATATAPTGAYEVLVGVNSSGASGTVTCWYRLLSQADEDRAWTEWCSAGLLTDNGSSTTSATFSAQAPGVTAYQVDVGGVWCNLGDAFGASTGNGWGDGVTAARLFPRSFSSRSLYIHDGVSIRAEGHARRLDSWSIAPDYTYHPNNALPAYKPSPRHGFRSNSVVNAVVAYRWADIASKSGPLLGVYVDECNAQSLAVELYDGSTWSSAGTLTLTQSFTFQRTGQTLVPDTAGSTTSTAQYIRENELAGAWARFPGGEIRQITSNTAGHWDTGAVDEVRPIVFIETIDGTEANSGTVVIQLPRLLALIPIDTTSLTAWNAIRFTFANDAWNAKSWQIGTLVVGNVLPCVDKPDNTRAVVLELGEELVDFDDGQDYATRYRPDRVRHEISWTRVIPLDVQSAGDWDYIKASTHANAGPLATLFETPLRLWGLLEKVGRSPVVWVPRIPIGSTVGTITQYRWGRAGGAVYGRFIPATNRIETALGEPEVAEGVRGSVVTLREVL